MRKIAFILNVIVALAVLVSVGRLWAEDKDKKPVPRTRVALFNLTYVIKNYDKYKNFQEEIKHIVDPLQKRDQKLRAQLEKLHAQVEKNKQGEAGVVPVKAEDLEEKAKKVQRELEDNQAKAKKALAKKSDEEMQVLYKDVEKAAKRYAAAHDFEIVLHYNDGVTKEEYLSTQNIARKLNTGGLLPMYTAPGIDVTMELVSMLNANVRKE